MHAGYVMYVTDSMQNKEGIAELRVMMSHSNSDGNLRNIFYYAPNGKPDAIKIIPLSEVATKDDFFNIKNATRDDLLSVHRVPPQMMGIIPSNTGGFGDVEKAAKVFVRNEPVPLQEQMKELNQWAGLEEIRFNEYIL